MSSDEAAAAPAPRFPIVGLGASAGGLDALEQFFRAMPPDSGIGFVVVQHLDPEHGSMLTEILQRCTTMPVSEAQDRVAVEPDHIYVIPPNRDMVIFHGALQLTLPNEPRGQRLPIDAFLRSLADDGAESAVGVVLSGTGSDGTLGLRAVQGAGGLCLAQRPESARYDGMPQSAIRAGYVTRVLDVAEMPQAIIEATRARPAVAAAAGSPSLAGALPKIMMLLRAATGHDFSLYKKSTIARRIERRMAQHDIADGEVFARFLKEHPNEVKLLFRELLINVTSFFRDAEAFAELETEILPALLADKPEGYVLRVWVAGCASGEEAYSIAILLREAMDRQQREFKIQLYATDIDDEAIATARPGLYPGNIAQDITPERLRRFFIEDEAGYRIKKEIREMVVFAVQSVIKDPPFTKLDLLACRNLMIYLEPELQERLIPTFHYALKPGGVLFLSPSESVGRHTELFEPVDRRWKFFRAKAPKSALHAVLAGTMPWATDGTARAPTDAAPRTREPQIAELARRALLATFAPASVITDPQGQVLFVHGETGRFLRPAPGHPSYNVVDMAREGLQLELREALRNCAAGTATLEREVTMQGDEGTQVLRLSLRPLADAGAASGLVLVSFQDSPARARRRPRVPPRAAAEQGPVEALERELTQAKETMATMFEEQQASNEELKSTNEELQSTNEELQSTNEELETSKEELQSVNEELLTVNAELRTKIDEMTGMQDDMKNLLDNIQVGTIFLDRQLVIRRFTRDATRAYRLLAGDVGRPLQGFRCELAGADLLADARTVLDTLIPLEREMSGADGRWYLARIQPYRTEDNAIDGVVVTFPEITEHVQSVAARKARDLAEAVVDTVREPLVVLDADLRVISANRSFYAEFGGRAEETLGRSFFECGDGHWNFQRMRDLLADVTARDAAAEPRPLEHDFPQLGRRRLNVTARLIPDTGGSRGFVLLAIDKAG